jgi:ribonuclease D
VPASVDFVDAAEAIAHALARLSGPMVGVDVERADSQRYFRRAALVQVGVAERCVLLDGVRLDAMPDLDRFLGDDRLTVLHASENDLAPLHRLGVVPDRVADTAVAAAVLGLPTGLDALLGLIGRGVTGDKESFQRADWEQRPLPPEMAAYAAGDVMHLPALWEELDARLHEQGRVEWYTQELTAVHERALADDRHWTRVKGAGRLSPPQRAVLHALWEEREKLARDHDIAPNHLLHDEALVTFAADPPPSAAELVRRARRRRPVLRDHTDALMDAIERGLDAATPPSARTGRRLDEADRRVLDALRRARTGVARDLGLDPGVLCPSKPLAAAVAGDPADGEALCRLAGLRPWQTDLLAGVLWDTYLEARDHPAADADPVPAAEPAG